MKTICIDIDGTICTYSGWRGSDKFGEVLPDAAESILRLHEDGWFVIIFSTRSDKIEVEKFLRSNNIFFDAVNENPHQPENALGGKPIADVYLDDRAVTFRGNWEEAYSEVVNFVPWERKGEKNAK